MYLSVRDLAPPQRSGSEVEIAAQHPTLDQVLDGVTAFARELSSRLHQAEVSKFSVEFGCEFAVESGTFIAVIGKASAKSTLKVGLEWSKPAQ
jgi:hypothetical protein